MVGYPGTNRHARWRVAAACCGTCGILVESIARTLRKECPIRVVGLYGRDGAVLAPAASTAEWSCTELETVGEWEAARNVGW